MLKAFITLFSGSLIGKVFGVIRELLLAAIYGTSAPVGAFRSAQTASLVPVDFFTKDTLNAGFIPLYNRYKFQEENIKKANGLFLILFILLLVFSIILTFALIYGASWWVSVIVPGFDEKLQKLVIEFVQVMALSIPFYIMGMLFSYLQMANNIYFLTSIRAAIQSIGVIFGILAAYVLGEALFIAWGFFGAYVVFMFLGLRSIFRLKLIKFSSLSLVSNRKEILRTLWQIMKPLLFLPIILQSSIVIEKIVASYMGIETVAALEYAKFISETGIVLLAVPLGMAGLSSLSKLSISDVESKLQKIIPLILMVSIPLSLYLALFSKELVTLIYARGAFNDDSILTTSTILFGLGIGFWAQATAYVLIKALNSQMQNKKVLLYMFIALFAASISNLLFYKSIGPMILGLSLSLYGIILFILTFHHFKLFQYFQKDFIGFIIAIILYLILHVNTDVNFLMESLLFIFYWLFLYFTIPIFRIHLIHFFHHLKKVKS